MNARPKPLLFSVRPCYADLIFGGHKEVELRRRLTPHMQNREAFIYVSSPTKQLSGGFRVGRVWSGPPETVWKKVSRMGIDRKGFDEYYMGCTVGHALEITAVWKYQNPIGLQQLRRDFPNFVVPQSWRYVTPEEHPQFLSKKTKE